MDKEAIRIKKENGYIMVMTETAIVKWRDLMGTLDRDADNTQLC